jgi:hypothetical protein
MGGGDIVGVPIRSEIDTGRISSVPSANGRPERNASRPLKTIGPGERPIETNLVFGAKPRFDQQETTNLKMNRLDDGVGDTYVSARELA